MSLSFHTEFITSSSKLLLGKDFSCQVPASYMIDIGNKCNLRCPNCFTGRGSDSMKQGIMKLATFERVFANIQPFAKYIALFNWGEPFINKDLLSIVRLCHENGVATAIDTNLIVRRFSPEQAEEIVLSGLGEMFIALDGATQITYEQYRVNGDLWRVIHNIQAIEDAKKRLEMKSPQLVWKFLVGSHNVHEIDTARFMADSLEIQIIFTPFNFWEKNLIHRKNKLGIPIELKKYGPCLEVIRKRDLPLPVGDIELHPVLHPNCIQPFQMVVVNWDGSVLPCCQLFEDEELGNLTKDWIQNIWNSDGARKARKFLSEFGPAATEKSICEQAKCPLRVKNLTSVQAQIEDSYESINIMLS